MIKKIALGFLSIFLLYGYSIAGNSDSENKNQDKFGLTNRIAGSDTYVHRVTSSGHIVNEQVGVGELGSPTYPWGKIYSTTGIARVTDIFDNVAAQSRDAVGSVVVSTTANDISSTTANLTQPAHARNLVIYSTFTTGSSSCSITAYAIVKGTDALGVVRQETIYFSTQNYIVNTTTTMGVGNIAWVSISSITYKIVSVSGREGTWLATDPMQIYVSYGNKIGLSVDIDSTSDVYHVVEAGSKVYTATVNAIYNTIDFATDPNTTNDYIVKSIQKYFTGQ